ncbi:hypothetical protein B0G93_101496 [Bacillus sp. V-88]|uniref:hypothetical protein n=1 Tax=Rossellomorea vietnamensis TaxID=218284 RepID=UPI00055133E6|nr:hypothetical protein [Rossellomorea vietnamensis]OXS64586.1 hypothetical protein B1B00_02350 [Bacillus sp. DSM 27956]PRX79746.1 hypothetical protein B0G93_101496 [Bacillus sp. V-88]SLK03279.1 hypothetical protein SAMN06295884_101496 [Bacillus sp. V-88]
MKLAFITTNFGFGPVSKTNYIIKAMREKSPQSIMDFFGSGVSRDFILNNSPVDHVYEWESQDGIATLAEAIKEYDYVVNVMEMDVLPHWKKEFPRMILVDSLNWMWDELPKGIENVSEYYIQDFLLDQKNINKEVVDTYIINPITIMNPTECKEEDWMLVNYSGMCNPFTSPDFFSRYSKSLTKIILEEYHDKFERIVFTTNTYLAAELQVEFSEYSNIYFECLPHDEFIELMSKSRLVLTTPGITATLEGRMLGKRMGYLLPSNYSQVLLSEKYSAINPDSKTMKLEDFNDSFAISKELPESIAVPMVNERIAKILEEYDQELRKMVKYVADTAVPYEKQSIEPLGQEQMVNTLLKKERGYQYEH